jgi:SAM-dependent methyltransferase
VPGWFFRYNFRARPPCASPVHETPEGCLTSDEIVKWFQAERSPSLSADDVVLLLNIAHPRTAFIKTLPRGAQLLDVGAGNGSLEIFRHWPAPTREDLKMYAYSLVKGERFDDYDGYELGRWEECPPGFPEISFDAVFSSHFIEHMDSAAPLVLWAGRRLGPGGRLYLEWPSPYSVLTPRREELARRGIALTISNFSDDATHRRIHDRSEVVKSLIDVHFEIETQGIVSMPLIEEEVLAHARGGLNDSYALQAAFWSKTKWAQYVVAVKSR